MKFGNNGKEIEVYEDDEEVFFFLEIEEQKERRERSSLHRKLFAMEEVTVDLPTVHLKRSWTLLSGRIAPGPR